MYNSKMCFYGDGLDWKNLADVEQMSLAAVAAGADGLEIEVHPDPSKALSDGAQSLTPEMFTDVMTQVNKVRGIL